MITVHHHPWGTHVSRDIKERMSALDACYAMGYFPSQHPLPISVKYSEAFTVMYAALLILEIWELMGKELCTSGTVHTVDLNTDAFSWSDGKKTTG